MTKQRTPAKIRILSKCTAVGECKLYPPQVGQQYPKVRNDAGVQKSAHVIIYELANGPVPAGKLVRHTCDTPYCCEELHLISGTPQDNMNDKHERGREVYLKAGDNGNAKLTTDQMNEVYYLAVKRTYTQAEIARRYGIVQSRVAMIKKVGPYD